MYCVSSPILTEMEQPSFPSGIIVTVYVPDSAYSLVSELSNFTVILRLAPETYGRIALYRIMMVNTGR